MTAIPEYPLLSVLTIGAVQAECIRAHLKHEPNGGSLLNPDFPTEKKLAALVEEVGEVGRALTYDQDHAGPLVKELIQVANVALSWVESLEGAHRNDYRRSVGVANVIEYAGDGCGLCGGQHDTAFHGSAEHEESKPLPTVADHQGRMADDQRKRRALLVALADWKASHDFMFVKRQDEEDWKEFRDRILKRAGFDG